MPSKNKSALAPLNGFRIEDVMNILLGNDITLEVFRADIVKDPMFPKVVRYGDMKYSKILADMKIEPFGVDEDSIFVLAQSLIQKKVKKIQSKIPKVKFLDRLIDMLKEKDIEGESVVMVSHEEMIARGFPVSCVKYREYWGNPNKELKSGSNNGLKALKSLADSRILGVDDNNLIRVENTNPTASNEDVCGDELMVFELVERDVTVRS